MPEARDRLSRQDGVVSAYSRRRAIRNVGRDTRRGGSVIFVLEDEEEWLPAPGTPFRWRGAAMVGTPRQPALTADDSVVTPRTGRRSALTVGRENMLPAGGSGRGRGRGSPLPIWYPRRPLREVTALVRAIERSSERRRGSLHQQTEASIPVDLILSDPSPSASDAHPEHDISLISPVPTSQKRRCPSTIIGKVPKILLGITQENDGDTNFLTPQKKLLNNIDTAEKVVMEELRKLKRTPLARREERRKRIRTLMSMR